MGIGGILFVIQRLLNALEKIGSERLLLIPGAGFFLLVAVYAVSNILLVLAWREVLLFSGETRIKRTQAMEIYALSQLAKYLPGNIFHLAGRQALGIAAGFSGKALMKSILGELVLISFVAIFFAFLVLPALPFEICSMLAFSLFCFSLFVILLLGGAFLKARMVKAFLLQFVFLAISGFIFYRCLALFGADISSANILPVIGAYVIAWLIGLLTPGAPAGLGVREAVLLFFLSGRIDESPLLLATILARIVSISGDVLFYAVAMLWSNLARRKS